LLNINKLKLQLDQLPKDIKVVSFDVFDTLLLRLLPSNRVTQIAAKELSQLINKNTTFTLSPSTIINSRKKFKQLKDYKYFYCESEWTLSEWLKELAQNYSLEPPILYKLAREAEIMAEFSCLHLAPDAIESISIARSRKLQVIAVSDIWLDQDWLKSLLKKFGLNFDAIFTSGSLGASKRRGSIFRPIEATLSLKSKNFIHLGDNLKADFIRPRMAGWQSIWMPHPGNSFQVRSIPFTAKYRSQKKSWKDITQALQVTPAKNNSNPYFQLAYEHLAPLLIIFSIVQWRKFREQNIDTVFYIARDAKVMLDVYNKLEHLLPGSCPRYYIRLSRRIVAIAHPDNLLHNVTHLAGKTGRKKVYEWLSNFTISPTLRKNILSLANVQETDNFTDDVYRSLRTACKRLSQQIFDEQHKQKQIIKDYLSQQVSHRQFKRVGIVDSGWSCTTQDCLQTVLNAELLSGVYLGVSAQGCKPNHRNIKYGLLRDDFRNCRHHNPLESTAGVIRMWDTILREPCETVTELYRKPNNKIHPVLANNKSLSNVEREAADSIYQGVLKGTLARLQGVSIIIELSKHFSDTDFEIAATKVARNISSQPNSNIAKAIMRLRFEEGNAGGNKGSLSGIYGIKKGTAWYPGILSRLGLQWITPVLEFAAKEVLRSGKQPGNNILHNTSV
jgi:predicted HAD superfamily hydrolase